MARKAVDSSNLPRPAVLASIGLLRRVVPLSTVNTVLDEKKKQSQRERMLPAQFLVYLVISLSLYMPYALREVLRCVMEGLRGLESNLSGSVSIATKGAISRARTRLGYEVMASLFAKVARPMAVKDTKGAWYRRWRLMGIDSTTLSLQHTPENEKEFGLPGGQNGKGAFPVLRLLGLIETGTHAVVAAAFGGVNKLSELALAQKIVSSLEAGMLLLEDRGFVGYSWYKKVTATGADVLCRVKNNMILPCLKPLRDGSYLSVLPPPKDDPGPPIPVRVIEYRLEGVPGAEPLYRLITSILDPKEAPARELAALYHERWEVEGLFDEFKTHIRGGSHVVLRSGTPDLVKQEVYGLLLAHYTVRTVMHDAALACGEDPDRLSFIHTVRVLRRRLPQAAEVSFSPSGT